MDASDEADLGRLRSAARIYGIGVFDHDHRSGALHVSPQVHALCGTDPDMAPAFDRFLAAVHPQDREVVVRAIANAHRPQGDGVLDIEHRVVHPNGELHWIGLRSRTTFEGEGAQRKAVRTLGAMIDASEGKQREEALHRRDRRLREAVRAAGIGIFDHDHRTGRIYWSAEQRANFGWEANVEVTLERMLAQVHPDDRAKVRSAVERSHDPSGDGLFDVDHRVVRPDGTVRWLRSRARTMFDGPPGARRRAHTIGVVLDITDQVAAAEAIRRVASELEQRVDERTAELRAQGRRHDAILETAIDGFFAADADGRIVETNPAYCRLLGYSRAELLQMTVDQIDARDGAAGMRVHLARVIREGHDRFEARRRRKDGAVIEVEVSANTVDLGGQRLVFAFVRDISGRKAAEQALRAAKEEAERANRAKSEFLSRMSHELRTPLNAVLGFGQLLELDGGAKERTYSREIVRAGRHLLALIDDMLDLARIEAGRLALSLEPVAVEPLLSECLALVRAQAQARRIRLPDVPDSCAVVVLADRTRLKQIVLNLLSNAIKFNPEQGEVVIACERDAEAPRPWVRISVTDRGPGLTAEEQQRIFVAFERLGADRRGIEGTGIGLALSRRLAETMNATMGVDSVPGAGSTFWLTLPLAAATGDGADAAARSDAASNPPGVRAAAGDPVDVLCIEDNPASLRLLEHVLAGRGGVRLLSAVAPGPGLELARARRPALILLDIHLPDLDGYAVMKCLREDEATRHIPVVALSANAMPGDIERGKVAGFVDYLTKPLSVARLMEVIDRILRARNAAGRD